MGAIKKYITIYKLTWKQATDYRISFIMEILCMFIPIIALYFLWSEIYSVNHVIEGYTIENMIWYMILARLIAVMITPDFLFEVMGEIQDGAVQHYICKPINYIKYHLVKSIGNKSRSILWSILCIVFFCLILNKNQKIDFSVYNILVSMSLLVLAFLLYFQMAMFISLLSFWFYEISSWYYTLTFGIEFLAGGLFPLALLPTKIQEICKFFPFQFLIYYPADVFIHGFELQEFLWAMMILLSWNLFFSILLKIIWKKGVEHYELIGG